MAKAFNALNDAKGLRDAMKGMGTNDKALIQILCTRTPQQVREITAAYLKEYPERSLKEDISSECSGNYKDALLAVIVPQDVYDARLVHEAISGIGTDENLLREVFTTRTGNDLRAAAKAYETEFKKNMMEEVKDDLDGDVKKLFARLIARYETANGDPKKVDELATKLYKAGEDKIGTNEERFIEIFVDYPRAYLAEINKSYVRQYGKPLEVVVKDEMGGQLEKTLVDLVRPIGEVLADRANKAMSGVGTNDGALIRLIVSQRGRFLKQMNEAYVKKYQKSLKAAVQSECSGDYEKVLVTILDHFV